MNKVLLAGCAAMVLGLGTWVGCSSDTTSSTESDDVVVGEGSLNTLSGGITYDISCTNAYAAWPGTPSSPEAKNTINALIAEIMVMELRQAQLTFSYMPWHYDSLKTMFPASTGQAGARAKDLIDIMASHFNANDTTVLFTRLHSFTGGRTGSGGSPTCSEMGPSMDLAMYAYGASTLTITPSTAKPAELPLVGGNTYSGATYIWSGCNNTSQISYLNAIDSKLPPDGAAIFNYTPPKTGGLCGPSGIQVTMSFDPPDPGSRAVTTGWNGAAYGFAASSTANWQCTGGLSYICNESAHLGEPCFGLRTPDALQPTTNTYGKASNYTTGTVHANANGTLICSN